MAFRTSSIRNADALAEAMLTLARNPELRITMSAAAKERCERLLSPTAVMPLMLETYARVTRNGHELPQSVRDSDGRHPWAPSETLLTFDEQTRGAVELHIEISGRR